MSRLTETQRAYDAISRLVRAEVLKRGSNMQDLQRFREALDVAFYLLGWAQFEHLTREEAHERIGDMARSHTVNAGAWQYIQQNLKGYPLRKKLDVVFHGDAKTLANLNKDYDLRNDAAHNYSRLPSEARDISTWLAGLEELIDKF
jgi:hypothetical protein